MQKYMFKMKETLKHLRRVALSIRNGQGSHCSDFLLPSVLSAFLAFLFLAFPRHLFNSCVVCWVGALGLGYSQFACFKQKKKNKQKNHAMIFL